MSQVNLRNIQGVCLTQVIFEIIQKILRGVGCFV